MTEYYFLILRGFSVANITGDNETCLVSFVLATQFPKTLEITGAIVSIILMTGASSPLSVVLIVVVEVWTGSTVTTGWNSPCLLVISITSVFIFEYVKVSVYYLMSWIYHIMSHNVALSLLTYHRVQVTLLAYIRTYQVISAIHVIDRSPP